MSNRRATVRIRRIADLQIKPDVEIIEGTEVVVQYGWKMGDDDPRYPGEEAWLIIEPAAPPICWIASGDLEFKPDA